MSIDAPTTAASFFCDHNTPPYGNYTTFPVRTGRFQTVSANDFLSGKCLFQRVTLDGIMRNVLRDEIDPNYVYFILECGDERIFAVLATNDPT